MRNARIAILPTRGKTHESCSSHFTGNGRDVCIMNYKHAKLLTCVLISMAFLSLLLVACTRPGSIPVGVLANSGDADSGGNVVHMNSAQFVQPSITLKKGANLTLIDDVAVPHTIFNGSWLKGAAPAATRLGDAFCHQSTTSLSHCSGRFTLSPGQSSAS